MALASMILPRCAKLIIIGITRVSPSGAVDNDPNLAQARNGPKPVPFAPMLHLSPSDSRRMPKDYAATT